MSESKKEIPGFYRDPITGKYYRDQPGSCSNPSLKKLKIEREFNEKLPIIPKLSNIVCHLNAREIKAIGGVRESKEYLKMKWYHKKNIETLSLWPDPNRCTGVDYIYGSKHLICGLWTNNSPEEYSIGCMKFVGKSVCDVFFHKNFGYVTDMCEALDNGFIIVHNPFYTNGLLVDHVDEQGHVPIYLSASRDFTKQFLCCYCNKNGLCYVFGCDNGVVFVDAQYRETFLKIYGRVHTISFDDTGNLMTSGLHTGKLIFHDLRAKEVIMNIEVSKSCIVDSKMMNSCCLIVAGTDDVLCNVDIRKKAVVTEYFSHKNQNIKKEPISIASNMLCALGSDNIIRIWDLSGGLPIHEIMSEDRQVNIKGWLHNVANKTQLYYFEGKILKVFKII